MQWRHLPSAHKSTSTTTEVCRW